MKQSRPLAVLAAALFLALLVPPSVAGSAPDVSGTTWSGPVTIVMKVQGHGKEVESRECTLYFEADGEWAFACGGAKAAAPLGAAESASNATWTQHGKTIRIRFSEDFASGMAAEDLAWVYSEIFDLGSVTDVPVVHVRSKARLKPKKKQLTWKHKEWGKVVGRDGKTYRVSLKAKGRELVQDED